MLSFSEAMDVAQKIMILERLRITNGPESYHACTALNEKIRKLFSSGSSAWLCATHRCYA